MGYDVGLLGDDIAYHGGMVYRNDAKGVPVGMGANTRGTNADDPAAPKLGALLLIRKARNYTGAVSIETAKPRSNCRCGRNFRSY
jgi:hypothetical protein